MCWVAHKILVTATAQRPIPPFFIWPDFGLGLGLSIRLVNLKEWLKSLYITFLFRISAAEVTAENAERAATRLQRKRDTVQSKLLQERQRGKRMEEDKHKPRCVLEFDILYIYIFIFDYHHSQCLSYSVFTIIQERNSLKNQNLFMRKQSSATGPHLQTFRQIQLKNPKLWSPIFWTSKISYTNLLHFI